MAKSGEIKILVVDDERVIIKGISDFFETKNFKVIEAYDGIECLEMARKEKPDLILLDVMMPNMDGFQALRALKEDNETIDIPVIMLTVKSGDEDKRQGMYHYAEKYITKPFDVDELYEEVLKSLRLRKKI